MLEGDEEGKFWVGGRGLEGNGMNGIFGGGKEGPAMHEEGIRKWPNQEEKMPDG